MIGSASTFAGAGSNLAAVTKSLWPSTKAPSRSGHAAASPAQRAAPQDLGVRRIPIAYFTRDTASLRSLDMEDADARSCDRRHPDASPAYGSVRQYIRDNDLMAGDKVGAIWRWLDAIGDQADSSELFVYDTSIRWYRESEADLTQAASQS